MSLTYDPWVFKQVPLKQLLNELALLIEHDLLYGERACPIGGCAWSCWLWNRRGFLPWTPVLALA